MSWWRSLIDWLNTAAESSLDRKTERYGLKRGDSCTLPYKRGNLKKGTEILISEVLSDGRHCRVVDYGMEYHIIHESYLDKIEEKEDTEETSDEIVDIRSAVVEEPPLEHPLEQLGQIQCPKCHHQIDVAKEISDRDSQKRTEAELKRYFEDQGN